MNIKKLNYATVVYEDKNGNQCVANINFERKEFHFEPSSKQNIGSDELQLIKALEALEVLVCG